MTVIISPDTTRDDLIVCAQHMNARARELSRTGRRGTDSAAYARLHADIDELIDAILQSR